MLFTIGHTSPPPSSDPLGPRADAGNAAGRDFFSQLDWQEQQKDAKSAGYIPFQDQDLDSGSSSGSSSSGSSDHEFNEFQAGDFLKSSRSAPGPWKQSSAFDQSGGSGLLIANFESESSETQPTAHIDKSGISASEPQIKLIEFGAGQEDKLVPASSSSGPNSGSASRSGSVPYVDPNLPASEPASTAPVAADAFGVVFDPFGGLSAVEDSSSKTADSAFGDLLGLGPDNSGRNSTQSGSLKFAGEGFGEPVGVPGAVPVSSSGTDNIFDPFGGLGATQATTGHVHSDPFTVPNGSAVSGSNNIMFNLLGDSPSLMPTMTPSIQAHRQSMPSTNISSHTGLLAPSAASQNRKLSSPEFQHHPQPMAKVLTNKLSASSVSNVSHSQPNLASLFVGNQPAAFASTGQDGQSRGVGMRGSVSHNTSPRQTPSPTPLSGSSGNVTQQQQATELDPFGQFNLKQVLGGSSSNGQTRPHRPDSASAASKASTKPAPPPTGNSYQPYYMQSQSGSRNGMQQPGSRTQMNSGKQAGTGMGPKTKSQSSAFTTQSPNYNPSLFSSVGNKTGEL